MLIEFDLSISIYNSEEDRNILKNYLIETLFPQNLGNSSSVLGRSLTQFPELIVGPTLENKVKGSYYIINRYFQKEIFLDMIMNDPDFSILYVDERFKVSKQQVGCMYILLQLNWYCSIQFVKSSYFNRE